MEFKLPNLGENIDSGDITNVLVSVGDTVSANQGVLEVETGKAVVEVPIPQAGKITKVLVKVGEVVKIGAPVLEFEPAAAGKPAAAGNKPAAAKVPAKPSIPGDKSAVAGSKPASGSAKPATPVSARSMPAVAARSGAAAQPVKPPVSSPAAVSSSKPASGAMADEQSAHTGGNGHTEPAVALAAPAGPDVRRLARELGVDLARVHGSGDGGRILREDIIAAVRNANLSGAGFAAPAPGFNERDTWGPIQREPLSRMRKTIAANMVLSAQTIPQLTNFDDADVTELERIRKASAEHYKASGQPIKLTALAFVMKAVALSLKAHKTINASIDMESGQITYKGYVNVGVAVDTEHGLMVPVMRDVDRMSIPHIAQAITAISEKAKKRAITPEEMTGGTFTISNLGAIGGTYSTPIINPPEVAILLVGRSRKLPVVLEDKIEPRLMMPLSLTYDHRLVDGAAAARFLSEVIGYLQSPGPLLLAH
jgi:pyruvate dehydrogenase E2 component (dihydrolipoamide acetyltransferase)